MVAKLEVDISDMAGAQVDVYPAAAVPDDLWSVLQSVHSEDMRAHLPKNEWERAAIITHSKESVRAYSEPRIHPNRRVGRDGQHDHQLLLRPMVAVVRDGSNQVVAGVTTDLNTSETPDPEKRHAELRANAIRWGKMLAPNWVPRVGGHRYVHIQDVFGVPNMPSSTRKPELPHALRLNGFVLAGLYRSLQVRDQELEMTAFEVEDDPADATLAGLVTALSLTRLSARENTIPGYHEGAQLVGHHRKVAAVVEALRALPNAAVILGTPAVRHTKPETWIDAWYEHRRAASELAKSDAAIQETRSWGK